METCRQSLMLTTRKFERFLYFYRRCLPSARYKCSNAYQRMRFVSESESPSDAYPSLKVLANGAYGLSRCLLLRVNGSSFLFNCGEAVDRTFKGHVNAVFLTHLDWNRIGGLPSLCHKLSTTAAKNVNMYGPDGLDVFISAAERYLPTNGLKIDIGLVSSIIVDNLEIVCVPITNRKMKYVKPTPMDKSWMIRALDKFQRKGSILNRPAGNKVALDTSFSYVCKAVGSKAWMLSQCVKRGLKPGPDMQTLWNGSDITLDDGTVVKPSDVIKVNTHSAIIVADCPSKEYLDDLLEKKEFNDYYKSENSVPSIIAHFTPFSVMMDQRYINWMKRFSEDTIHLIVNDSNEWNVREKVINRHEVCKRISPRFFPNLSHSVELKSQENHCKFKINNDCHEVKEEIHDYVTKEVPTEGWLQRWRNLPQKFRLFQSWCGTIVNLKDQEIFRLSEPFGISNVESLIESSSEFNDPNKSMNHRHAPAAISYPKVTFLGTSSQGGSTYRNSSGILVQSSPNQAILLDCGDGTLHQLATMFSQSQFWDTLLSLKCIYLSHPHADHHTGIIGVLLEMKKARKACRKKLEGVVLFAPAPLIEWLEIYHNRFEPILENIIPIVISDIIASDLQFKQKMNAFLRKSVGLKRVLVCRATHCPFSYCVSFEHTAGWKISYSGDTKISDAFVRIGFNSDLLIHEATYASDLRDIAQKHAHCTTADAIEVGRRMEAKHIIITHFSKRYPVIPYLKDLENTTNVSVAFDFLQVSLQDLHLLPRLKDTYKVVFEEYEKANEEESAKIGNKPFLSEELDEDDESLRCNDN